MNWKTNIIKWPVTVTAAVATYSGWNWAWGIIFLCWAAYGLVTGREFVIVVVRHEENPALF